MFASVFYRGRISPLRRRVSFWTAKKKPKSRQGAVQMGASRPYSRSPGPPFYEGPPMRELGGQRKGAGGAQVRLSEATHPETFRDFRRRVTLGRPRFLGFSHVVCPFGTFPPDSGNRPSPLEGEGMAGGHTGPPLQEVRNPPPHPPPSGAPPPKGKVSRSAMFHTGRVGSAT